MKAKTSRQIHLAALPWPAVQRWDGTVGEVEADAPSEAELQAAVTAAPDDPAQTQKANQSTIETNVEQALTNLRAYVALANPTAAQTAAAVKVLCRVAIAVVRLQLRRLDAVD